MPRRPVLTVAVLETRDLPAGLYLAAGDVSGANAGPEIVTGAGPGGGPVVRIVRPADGVVLKSFFAFEPEFRGGVQVAVGDVTGDGRADIVVGTGVGGGPRVRVFDGATLAADTPAPVVDFFAYEPSFRGGVQVAAVDTDGDGRAEIITGTGVGGGPRVRVLTVGAGGAIGGVSDFFAYENTFRGGVLVAAADLDGDGKAEVVTGTGVGGGPAVRTYSAAGVPGTAFFAFDSGFRGGVFVAAGDLDGDGKAELMAAPVAGGPAEVRTFDGLTTALRRTDPVAGADGLRLAAAPTTAGGPVDLLIGRADGGFGDAPTIIRGSRPGTPSTPTSPLPSVSTVTPVSPPATPAPAAPSRTFEDADWTYYLPAGLASGQTYPVVFAFDPGRNAHAYDGLMRPVADQNKWILATSKYFSNVNAAMPRPDMDLDAEFNISRSGKLTSISSTGTGYQNIRNQIASAMTKVPGDSTLVILMGISGGGSISHALSLLDPGLASGLIISTGMIWGDVIQPPTTNNPNGPGEKTNGDPWSTYLRDSVASLSQAFINGNSRRQAVFLEGTGDFRRREMTRDAGLLRAAGWAVDEIEFPVDHGQVPGSGYQQAAAWLTSQAAWRA